MVQFEGMSWEKLVVTSLLFLLGKKKPLEMVYISFSYSFFKQKEVINPHKKTWNNVHFMGRLWQNFPKIMHKNETFLHNNINL